MEKSQFIPDFAGQKARSAVPSHESGILAGTPALTRVLGNQGMLEFLKDGAMPGPFSAGSLCVQRMEKYKPYELVKDMNERLQGAESSGERCLSEISARIWIEEVAKLLLNIKEYLEKIEVDAFSDLDFSEEYRTVLNEFRENIERMLQGQERGEETEEEDAPFYQVNNTWDNLFNLARYLIVYRTSGTLENRMLCYTLVHRMLMSLSDFIPSEIRENTRFSEDLFLPDEELDKQEKALDFGEVQTAAALIRRIEGYEANLKRTDIPFEPKLEAAMPVGNKEARCHVIPYAYLKSGIFTPVMDAAAGLVRFLARREAEIPMCRFDLQSALMGVLFAAFPLYEGWESENKELEELSRDLLAMAEMEIDRLCDMFYELCVMFELRTVAEISYDDFLPMLNLAEEILKLVNSSPQNLRVGNSTTNTSILDALDIPAPEVSNQVIEGHSYADDLSHLEMEAGQFGQELVHFVEPGSPTNLALIALLTLVEMGDDEITAYSGTLNRGPQPAKPLVQSSEITKVTKDDMSEDNIPLVVPMSEAIVDEFPIAEYLELDELPEAFRFQVSGEAGKSRKKPGPRITGYEPMKTRKLANMTPAQYRKNYLKKLNRGVMGEQLSAIGLSTVWTSAEGNNCFFYSIYTELVNELVLQGVLTPADVPSIQALIQHVRGAIGNAADLIDMDNTPVAAAPLRPTAGRQVLDQIVAFFHGGFQIDLEVTQPVNVDYQTGQVEFGQENILSASVPGGPVIRLRTFFNGVNHFEGLENIVV